MFAAGSARQQAVPTLVAKPSHVFRGVTRQARVSNRPDVCAYRGVVQKCRDERPTLASKAEPPGEVATPRPPAHTRRKAPSFAAGSQQAHFRVKGHIQLETRKGIGEGDDGAEGYVLRNDGEAGVQHG